MYGLARKTWTVNSDAVNDDDFHGATADGANTQADSAVVAESVGDNDIAWPIPEVTMWPLAAALVGLMVWAFGFDWVLVSIVPFSVLLAVITVIDLRELRIPDKLTKPAALLTFPLLGLSLLSDWDDVSLVRALLGALALGAFYFLLFFIYPAGMGFGDVKLSPIIGAQLAFFGWIPLGRGLLASYLIVGPAAIALLLLGKARRNTGFPFGPFMVAGAMIALVLEARGR